MGTSIFVNGRVTQVPNSYSEVDASGLEQVSLGATGIVAVLGTGEGGRPVADITKTSQFVKLNKPEKVLKTFRSGDLREVGDFLFAPAKDDQIGGAASVIMMKTNPALQAEASLQASSADVIDLTSKDWGAFTNQINIEVADGTNQGKALTIRFEDVTETVDDLGGDVLSTLQYSGGTNGYTTAVASINDAGDITVTATRAGIGLATDLTNAHTGGAAQMRSSDAGDTTQLVTIFGLKSGVATKVTFALTGTSNVDIGTWDASGILAVLSDSAHAGTITVEVTSGGLDIITLATGTLSKGVRVCDYHFVDKTSVTAVLDSAGTPTILLFGRNAAGSALAEALALTGAVAVTSAVTTYANLDFIVSTGVAVARTLTITARAARALATVQKTIKKAADYFNAKSEVSAGPTTRGFIFDVLTGSTTLSVANLDVKTSVNIKSAASLSITANLYTIVAWINANSQLVTAEVAANATAVPDNTSSPLFLTGGAEGTATFTDYQTALNLLKRVRVNVILDLSGDPAVAAAVDAHCAYMGGIGRNERDAVIPLLNNAMTGLPTKTEIIAQIVDLNSRHIRAVGQGVVRFNTSGAKEEFSSPFFAALIAGATAGSVVGTSLTHKLLNCLELVQDSSWNPTDDAEEMIEAGLCFAEEVDGLGRRVVRNVTTHLSSNNIAFVEASVNEAVNLATFSFRTQLEFAVGKQGFSGTVSATRTQAIGILDLLTANTIITGWRSLDLELLVDVLDVSVEMAPVIPINFVKSVIHLITLAQLAARAA